MQPVHPFHQLANGRHNGAELDPNRPVLARRLDDDRKLQIVREIEPATERFGEDRRVNAVKAKIFFAIALSCASINPFAPVHVYLRPRRSRKAPILKSAVSSSANDSARLKTRSQSALARPSRLFCVPSNSYAHWLVAKLRQRVGNFLLDFFLVERADDGRLVGRSGLLLGLVHENAVIENDDAE